MEKKGILLETGTNELEIVEFVVGGVSYGLNVAKVTEIILMPEEIMQASNMHESIIGLIDYRGEVLPMVDLSIWMEVGKDKSIDIKKKRIIISEVNKVRFAFVVDSVNRIHRLKWSELEPPQRILAASKAAILGVIRKEQRLIVMIDIEKIIDDIDPEKTMKTDMVPNKKGVDRETVKLFLADDSNTVRMMLGSALEKSGYTDFTYYTNGKELWNKLLEIEKKIIEKNKNLSDYIDLIVTDIEMPSIDGLHLIKRIKENENLSSLNIIVFSSLADKHNIKKSLELGAKIHVGKPDVTKLINTIDELMHNLRLGEQQ